MSFGDAHSFLFGLNQFATPSNNNSPQASGSNNNNNGSNGTNTADGSQQNTRGSSLLTGLDSFDGNDNGLLEGGSFADQLELWTNANFSFDGPTGHALLGDEDKEKDEGEKKDEDKDELNRAEKRARNEANNRSAARRGKGRQRDEEEDDHIPDAPVEPTHQTHKDHAALQQQQHYFAPPSRSAEEARRPGFDQNGQSGVGLPSDRSRSSSQQEHQRSNVPTSSSAPNGPQLAAFGQQVPTNNLNLGSFNGQQQPFPLNLSNGVGGAPATPNLFNGQQPQPHQQQQQHPQTPGQQLDLTSLLALQQLVAQNPLAVASLGSFAGLNPQLGALGAQLSNLGALNGLNLQQLQQLQQQQHQQHQQHQQQQQQQQSNGALPFFGAQTSPTIQASSQPPPFGQFNPGFQNGWPLFNNSFSHAPPTGGLNANVPSSFAPTSNGNTQGAVNVAGAPQDDDDNDDDEEEDRKRRKDRKKRMSSSNGKDSAKPPARERKMSSSDGNMSSESGGYNSKMSASERAKMLEERAAERDDIPPLKLIDTGNPEADAEANRLAIEEDKRRRNTAASARFRVKKKQREAALEAHSKELSNQLSELKDEVTKLRSENQWLKGLIQVRPGGKEMNGVPSASTSSSDKGSSSLSAPEALQAAQQLQALQQAVTLSQQNSIPSNPGKQVDRLRDTGIRPRGVGTNTKDGGANAGSKRDREE